MKLWRQCGSQVDSIPRRWAAQEAIFQGSQELGPQCKAFHKDIEHGLNGE